MGRKIKEAEKQKIPYILVVGDSEVKNQSVAIRKRKGSSLGVWNLEEAVERFNEELCIGN